MRLARVGAVVLRQFYLLRGSLARVVPLFAWVAVDIVLWGYMTRYLDSVSSRRLDFVGTLLGAVLLWDFFTRVMNGVSIAFFEDLWTRNFLNVFASPLTIPEYLTGLVLTSVATSAVGLAAMLILAAGVFGLSFAVYGAALVPYLAILFLFGIALGVLAVALVLRLGPAAEWFVWPIPALVAPFAGVFYPVATLPAWMRLVARAIPPSYVFESMRAVGAGRAPSAGAAAAGAALSAAYVGLSFLVFSATYRSCVRDGLLARYSAESVS